MTRIPILAAIACLLLLAQGCDSSPGARPTPRRSSTVPTTGTPTEPTATDADNKRLATAAGRRSVRSVRLPAGSVRLARKPTAVPRDTGFGGWADGATAWYEVPTTRSALGSYLEAHPPRGTTWDGSSGSGPWTSSLSFEPRRQVAPAAYDGPFLEVIWGVVHGKLLVQAHADVRARHVRPADSYVGAGATSVEVRRTAPGRNGHARPPVVLTITTPGIVTRLQRAVDGLHGSYLVPLQYDCPFFGDPPGTLELVFQIDGHVLAFAWQQGCGQQVSVSRDGRTLGVTLDPGTLARTVDRVVRHSRRD
ncbi:MAG TPA: hypothetical protein VFE07_05380 [Marmoricola sp.]|nr:hypothetical protein [Marmoricola sp.]